MEVTNHTPGARGFNLEGGGTHWLEPGQAAKLGGSKDKGHTIDIDGTTHKIVGGLPDFGKPGQASDADADHVAALEARNAELEARVIELEAEIEAAKKPPAK